MIKEIVLQLFLWVLFIACVVGVIYSPIDKGVSMWIAGGIYFALAVAGGFWILREK